MQAIKMGVFYSGSIIELAFAKRIYIIWEYEIGNHDVETI